MRPAIRAWLARNTEPEMARMNYVEELMKVSTSAEVLLLAPRVEVERSAGDAALGPATAPVEIVVFGDFESEGYAALASAFGRVRDMFGDRLRLVFKHLPVLGPESQAVAEAAACANAQGRFWPFHDAVISQPGPFGPSRLKQIARDAKLTADVFDACVDGGQSRAARPSGARRGRALRHREQPEHPGERPAGAAAAAVPAAVRVFQAADRGGAPAPDERAEGR